MGEIMLWIISDNTNECCRSALIFLPKHFFLRIFSFLGAIYISIEIVQSAQEKCDMIRSR